MEPELLPNVRPHILVLESPLRRKSERSRVKVTLPGRRGQCKGEELTISTNFSKKGTSFSSSLSFLSMNQLSIGIPLDNWKSRAPDVLKLYSQRCRRAGGGVYLICEGLW